MKDRKSLYIVDDIFIHFRLAYSNDLARGTTLLMLFVPHNVGNLSKEEPFGLASNQ